MVRVVSVGDIMLGRELEYLHPQQISNILKEDVINLLQGDIVTGNLECLLTRSEIKNPYSHSHFRADPSTSLRVLQQFHVLNCANNHIFDFEEQGVIDTLQTLAEANISSVGIGSNWEQATAPAVFTIGHCKIAIYGTTTVPNLPSKPSHYTISTLDERFLERITCDVQEYDHVLVHLHAGEGDFLYPSPHVRSLHRELLLRGVRAIFGHHPHIIQGWEQSYHHVNFYSLGDFIFDRINSNRQNALIVTVDLIGDKLDLKITPVERQANFEVTIMTEEKTRYYLDKLAILNSDLKSNKSDQSYHDQLNNQAISTVMKELKKEWNAGGAKGILRRTRRISIKKALVWGKSICKNLASKYNSKKL
jgi:poly-gamma-glutamate synthesis protein (capsule biosynthesis protein)